MSCDELRLGADALRVDAQRFGQAGTLRKVQRSGRRRAPGGTETTRRA